MSRIGKSIEQECRLEVARGWGEGEMERDSNDGVSFWGDENVLKLIAT